jgi:hypothetical protein
MNFLHKSTKSTQIKLQSYKVQSTNTTFYVIVIIVKSKDRERERERVSFKQRNATQRNEEKGFTMITYGNMNDLHSQQFQFGERLLQDDNNETEFTSSNSTTIVPGEGNATMAPSMVPIPSPTDTSPVSSPNTAPVSFPTYDDKDSFPISAPSYSMDYPAADPYSPTDYTPTSTTTSGSSTYTYKVIDPFYGIIVACIIGIIVLLIAWKCCKRWKSRRERQMLRLQSSRVDAVLGDMQVRFSYIYIYIYIYLYIYNYLSIFIVRLD